MKLFGRIKMGKKHVVIVVIGLFIIALRYYVFKSASLLSGTWFETLPNRSRTNVGDVLFTVKTSKKNYKRRLDIILATWYNNIAKDQVRKL